MTNDHGNRDTYLAILWLVIEKGKGEEEGESDSNREGKPEAGRENPTEGSGERFLTIAQGCHGQRSQDGQREQALHGVSGVL